MNTDNIGVAEVEGPTRFQLVVDGVLAGFAQFLDDGEDRIFFHTVVEPAFGGRGLGGRLVEQALARTREAGKGPVALCPFVADFLDQHPEYADLRVEPTDAHRELAAAQAQQ